MVGSTKPTQSSTHINNVASAAAADDVNVGTWMRTHKNAAMRVLGLPVRGLEMIGAAVIKWAEGPPPSDTDWMHSTHFPSDKIRQECIDSFWEDRERAARAGK